MKVIHCSICGSPTPDKYIDGRCCGCSNQGSKRKQIINKHIGKKDDK